MTLQIALDLISQPAQGFLVTFNVKPAPHRVLSSSQRIPLSE
jgi:hypothetical protein